MGDFVFGLSRSEILILGGFALLWLGQIQIYRKMDQIHESVLIIHGTVAPRGEW